jgi:hypothetical protein
MVSLGEQLQLKSRRDGEDKERERGSDRELPQYKYTCCSIVCHI